MPDDPLTPLPLEIFMRDYYEPRLLPRILAGEKFNPVRRWIYRRQWHFLLFPQRRYHREKIANVILEN
jgi:hypothetical protein